MTDYGFLKIIQSIPLFAFGQISFRLQSGYNSAQISICIPSSTTLLGGNLKKLAALVALRDINAKIFSRHSAMPGAGVGIKVSLLKK